MEMNDPLRKEEKKESSPDQERSEPSSPLHDPEETTC